MHPNACGSNALNTGSPGAKLLEKVALREAIPMRARAFELAISASGQGLPAEKLIQNAEAIYQWLCNGPRRSTEE